MSAVLTQPIVQSKTRVRADTGGGGGSRNYTKARTGGGGGGGGGELQYQDCRNVQAGKKMTEAERDMAVEEANQYRYGFEARRAELQAEVVQEQCRTLLNVKAETEQKTQNAELKTLLARGQGARIQANIQITAAQLQGDQLKMQGVQQQNQFLSGSNQIQSGLHQQHLMAMNLQLTETSARNQHQQQLLSFQGWAGNALPSTSRMPVTASFGSRSVNLPPIRGFKRTW